jgi:hypothetical protein
MQLRIDTEGVAFFCTKPPEPKVDFETGVVKADRDSGEHLWRTQLAAVDPTGGEIVQVTVAGEPQVAVGAPVQVTGLVAIPWTQGDRSGVAFRAERITATGSPVTGIAPTSGAKTSANPGGGSTSAKPAA